MTDKQTSMPRLGVLISGGGTTLQNLAEQIASGKLRATIGVVIASNGHCHGIERARRLGLPVEVITRKEAGGGAGGGTLEAFSERIAGALRAARVDLALMAGFLSLWTIPEDFQGRVMNIHPALLPKFGGKGMHGRHVHEAVLAAGEKESGCTVHFADNRYDTGPVILQRRVRVEAGDTAETLAARVFEQEKVAYPEAVRWWGEGVLERGGERAYLRKVVAYITRTAPGGGREMLVFEHVHVPEAGTQVVQGTLHHGEDAEAGVLREAREETGLEGLRVVRKLGVFWWRNVEWGCWFERHVYELAAGADVAETWEHYETDGGRIGESVEKLFRFRWAGVEEAGKLAGGQGLYAGGLLMGAPPGGL
ncbi:MAG TPA: phosphoribosylglycinamide formyltransferase [Phycisphaerae bacterium]|nr:phosphoribosylglycinamide formyltransferase [Phycisphaerae bacterium]